MQRRYHIEIIRETLGDFFSPASLRAIWRANVRQDSIRSMFGYESRRHACDCKVADCLTYIDEEHALIVDLCKVSKRGKEQRAAFGRLLHTVHDLYAHTSYVSLWLSQSTPNIESERKPARLDGLDPAILAHPALQVASWNCWREPLYYLPLVGQLLRRYWVAAGSHEAIHLDSPKRGAHFAVAMAVARQRTLQEYARAVAAIREAGGRAAVADFHGNTEDALKMARPRGHRERMPLLRFLTQAVQRPVRSWTKL